MANLRTKARRYDAVIEIDKGRTKAVQAASKHEIEDNHRGNLNSRGAATCNATPGARPFALWQRSVTQMNAIMKCDAIGISSGALFEAPMGSVCRSQFSSRVEQ
jgi:N-acetylmuramoyl-L-alanine amidase CwlA